MKRETFGRGGKEKQPKSMHVRINVFGNTSSNKKMIYFITVCL